MADGSEGSIKPKITRTNSIFPSSKKQNHDGEVYSGAFGGWLKPGEAKTIIYPMIDPRSGQPTGNYRDFAGNLVDKEGHRLDDQAAKAKRDAEAKKKAEKAQSDYRRQVAESRAAGPLTVDGVDIKPLGWTVNANGTKIGADGKVTDENGKDITNTMRGQVAAQQSAATSVFNGLNLSDIPNNEQFVMSRGNPTDPITGKPRGFKEGSDMDSLGARARRQQEAGQPESTNMMSIAGGVRWLRRLSVSDPKAYNQMVVMLRNAGYINGSDEQLPLNGWSKVAGEAFAYAAHDLAGAAAEGEDRTLADWLTERGKTLAEKLGEDKKAAEYQPVDRSYQDPATLAASARSAAEQALGRALTPEEEKRFMAHFRGMENTAYDSVDAAGRSKGVATYTSPDATGQADAFVHGDEFNDDRGKMMVGGYMDALKNLVGL